MVATFEQAYADARDSYTVDVWRTLKIAEQCAAIYREMRRIDEEHAQRGDGAMTERLVPAWLDASKPG